MKLKKSPKRNENLLKKGTIYVTIRLRERQGGKEVLQASKTFPVYDTSVQEVYDVVLGCLNKASEKAP